MILHGIEYQRPTSLNMRILADHVTYSFLAFMKSIFHFCLGCYCGGYSQNGRSNLSSLALKSDKLWDHCDLLCMPYMVMSQYSINGNNLCEIFLENWFIFDILLLFFKLTAYNVLNKTKMNIFFVSEVICAVHPMHYTHMWPLLLTWINFNEITYPFLNFNGCSFEV